MPIETRFDDLDLREEPARVVSQREPLLGSSNVTEFCNTTAGCTKVCCTCPPP
jgi:hypothetical protein